MILAGGCYVTGAFSDAAVGADSGPDRRHRGLPAMAGPASEHSTGVGGGNLSCASQRPGVTLYANASARREGA